MHSPGLEKTHWSAHMGSSEGDKHTYTHKTAIKVIALTYLTPEAQTQIDSYLAERMGDMITNNLNWKAKPAADLSFTHLSIPVN